MASRKLTQLPTATEVTTSDKIYIVDVSDTTESPQGTSKQALISELPSSGITTLTSTDGSIDIDLTDPTAPDLSVGYTELVMLYSSVDGDDNGTLTILKQDVGFGTITATRVSNQVAINSSTTPFTESKTFSLAKFIGDDNERVLNYVDLYSTNQIVFIIYDVDGGSFSGQLGNGTGLICKIVIQVYP